MRIVKYLVVLLVLFPLICHADLPLIQANNNNVNIRDGHTLIQRTWVTIPQIRPDIYRTIRSDATRKVTFYTDLDSISFTLRPGDEKDFVILLGGKDSCFTRISTLNGVQLVHDTAGFFMQAKVYLPMSFFLLVLGLASWRYRQRISTNGLLQTGLCATLLFWSGTIVGGLIHGSYNHLVQVVSELGAVGTRSEVFMSAITIIASILSLYFIAGLLIACKKLNLNILPVLTIISFTIMFFSTGLFPMGNPLHTATGPVFLLLPLGALLVVILWRGSQFKDIRALSLLSFFIMLLILLKFTGQLEAHYPGLIQRFVHLGWSVWFISLSICFTRYLKKI